MVSLKIVPSGIVTKQIVLFGVDVPGGTFSSNFLSE